MEYTSHEVEFRKEEGKDIPAPFVNNKRIKIGDSFLIEKENGKRKKVKVTCFKYDFSSNEHKVFFTEDTGNPEEDQIRLQPLTKIIC